MFSNDIFKVKTDTDFDDLAMKIFRFQAENNLIYKQYLAYVGIKASQITTTREIPFLPISFFKRHEILSVSKTGGETVFTSSGTGLSGQSKHYVSDIEVYERSFSVGFNRFFGKPQEYVILALLPGYLERKGSSLIYMVKALIERSSCELSGFFLDDFVRLDRHIQSAVSTGKKVMLIGVSFALIDYFKQFRYNLPQLTVIETGGMKGRRRELLRSELHEILRKASGSRQICSEYGMTELLSQAYLMNGNSFKPSDTMRVYIRDLYDPFSILPPGKVGGINVADLANYNSCSFIETQDLGRLQADGSFEVLGRYDHSDIRGCNLMVV